MTYPLSQLKCLMPINNSFKELVLSTSIVLLLLSLNQASVYIAVYIVWQSRPMKTYQLDQCTFADNYPAFPHPPIVS